MTDIFETQADSTSGKYFNVDVPDFTNAAANAEKRHAYLRVGSMNGFVDPSVHGAALWGKFSQFYEQSPTDTHLRAEPATPTRPVKYKSETPSSPSSVTSNLFAHAGWRDHCDGNRISTTAGDKVEVIGGNYQLIVLGRASDVGDGVTVDASGGVLLDGDVMPGAVTRVEYTSQKFGGTWKVTEEVEKGHVVQVFTGEFREEFRGSSRISVIGNTPANFTVAPLGDDGPRTTWTSSNDPNGNPDVVEATWASSLTEYVGTSGNAIPKVATLVHATDFKNVVNAHTFIDRVYADNITRVQDADTVTEKYHGSLDETFGTASDPAVTVSTFYGGRQQRMYGGHAEIVVGAITNFFFGGKLNITLAKTIELLLGAHLELHIGSFREITWGKKSDIVIGDEHEETFGKLSEVSVTKKQAALAIFLG